MDTEADSVGLVRANQLWFEDGGIIVKAETTLFRLSRGVLIIQSPIFADLFSLPQPPDAETMDGCAVVNIPDAAEDATVFFRAIFDSSFFEAYPASTTPEVLAGVLRLSSKYEVEHLRRRALVHLSSQFPSKLEDWDRPRFGARASALIPLIELSRQCRAPWILPTVYYRLGCDVETNLPLLLRGKGRLSDDDHISFVLGSSRQREATRTVARFLYDPPTIAGCMSIERCAEDKLSALDAAADDCDACPCIPLDIWVEDDWDRLPGLCVVCLAALRVSHKQARQDLWARIPRMYGLPPREELEDLKKAAIGDILDMFK
ncbi:hypothetical protein DFH06DRAFT_1337570 [Mycena polygramma]|nr:hypothetical protein DFH06DRAFT_1337570 [Mycena polygramma]